MYLLRMPAVLPCLRFDCHHRNGEGMIAPADGAVAVGPGIAGGEIDQAQFRVDSGRLPYRRAAMLPRVIVIGPGLMTDLARSRDRKEGPDQAAIFGVIRFDAAPYAILSTRETNDHHSVVIERGGRNCVALLPTLGLNGPRRCARFFIQRHEPAVQLSDKNLSLPETHATACPAATDRRDFLVEPGLVFPESLARFHADRENVIGTSDDVHHSIVNNRLRFARVLRGQARTIEASAPHTFQVRDVLAIDLCKRRVILIEQITSALKPAVSRRR